MIKNQECALMNVCQNTCALGRLVPLRNSADDPRCIVALLFSLTCFTLFFQQPAHTPLFSLLYVPFPTLLLLFLYSSHLCFYSSLLFSSSLSSTFPSLLSSRLYSSLLFLYFVHSLHTCLCPNLLQIILAVLKCIL